MMSSRRGIEIRRVCAGHQAWAVTEEQNDGKTDGRGSVRLNDDESSQNIALFL